jgi:exodeoxyribonuclease V beta subunit
MSPTPPKLLDPLRFSLRGNRLIEASAGTGKTFTIAALYLRLVLGHGGEAAFDRPLNPPDILVVTFTEAATQELRGRIRDRLAQAARCFEAGAAVDGLAGQGFDDLLLDLRAGYPTAEWPACAARLRLAAEWMDEAAVSTIHAWCQRMLSEHAFDSGSLFTQQLEADQRELMAEAVRDHWRAYFTPLPPEAAARVRAWWSDPAALLKAVQRLHAWREHLPEGLPPAEALQVADDQAAQMLGELQRPWAGPAGWAVELAELLEQAVAAKSLSLHHNRKKWMAEIHRWAHASVQDGAAAGPSITKEAWARLSPGSLADLACGDIPAGWLSHPGWQALADLRKALAQLPDARFDMLCHAVHDASHRFEAEQQRRAQIGFDALLLSLDRALQGPGGQRLAERIRRQFPVALIDEFQDTDALQYRIFDAVYRLRENAGDTALVLIGDPKQAIYGFRGADIHTYLRARLDTAGRLETLGTNYRSSHAMVEAVNRLFASGEAREDGAFGFRQGDDNPVPFQPVQARGRAERWVDRSRGADSAPALVFWTLETPDKPTVEATRQRMAQACASEVVRLLRAGQANEAGFARDDGLWRPVQPGDLAVLVQGRTEANAVRQALRERGVRSVYLSDGSRCSRARWRRTCSAGCRPAPNPMTTASCVQRWPPPPWPCDGTSWTDWATTNWPGRRGCSSSATTTVCGSFRACCPCCGACCTTTGCRVACWPRGMSAA